MSTFFQNYLKCGRHRWTQMRPNWSTGLVFLILGMGLLYLLWSGKGTPLIKRYACLQDLYLLSMGTPLPALPFLLLSCGLEITLISLLLTGWEAVFIQGLSCELKEIWLLRLSRLWSSGLRGRPRLREGHALLKEAFAQLNLWRFGMFMVPYFFNRLTWILSRCVMGGLLILLGLSVLMSRG